MDTAMLRSFPALGASLAAAIVVGGVAAQLSPVLHQTLGLTAARAISRPWTLLTCAFTQPNILCSLASALAVLFLTRIVEPSHGPRELAKYLAAVIVLSSCLTVAVVTILYYASATSEKSPAKADSAGFMLFKPMGGFEAGLAALLVAVKQLLPDNEVAILGGALSFSAKHLPGLYAVAMVAASLLLGGAVRVIPFTLFGTYLSWAYLRFVQSRNGARGDLSEEFRFATFFPGPLQPPVDKLAAACTRVTGLGASTGSTQPQAAWNYAMGGSVLPGTEDSDAARRRERGAKALEERLGFKKAVPAAAPPQPPAAASSTKEAGQPAEAAAADIEAAVAPAADP